MISRQWSALCHKEKANEYILHLLSETFQTLKNMKGFLKASILTREENDGVNFLIVTVWNSIDDIRTFSGEDVEKAVVPENIQQMMIRYDSKARHYKVIEEVTC